MKRRCGKWEGRRKIKKFLFIWDFSIPWFICQWLCYFLKYSDNLCKNAHVFHQKKNEYCPENSVYNAYSGVYDFYLAETLYCVCNILLSGTWLQSGAQQWWRGHTWPQEYKESKVCAPGVPHSPEGLIFKDRKGNKTAKWRRSVGVMFLHLTMYVVYISVLVSFWHLTGWPVWMG